MPKVSVIVPVYGVEKYIERCARSLFEQTLDDIEFIFINDCTKDHSVDILKSVLKEYPQRLHQTRIVDMSTNSGLAAVRRHGIQIASGDFIAHCDSDDWVDTNMYKSMYEEAIISKSDIVICDFYQTDGTNHKQIKACYSVEHDNAVLKMLQGKGYWSTWNKLISRSLYDKVEYYPKVNTGEDMVLIIQLMYFSNKISYIATPLYYYMTNENSIIRNKSKESIVKRFNQAIENTDIIQKFMCKHMNGSQYRLALDFVKFKQRNFITPLLSEPQYYKLWMSVFPDLLYKVWYNPNIQLKKRIKFYLAVIRLYKQSI